MNNLDSENSRIESVRNDGDEVNEHLVHKSEVNAESPIDTQLYEIKSKCKYKQEYVDQHVLLSVNHLKQYFFFGKGPSRSKLKAVHDVSFQVHEGECFGIVGESGCGKTTTGRCIIRLYNITSGSIYYRGYRISAGDRWNRKEIKYAKIHFKEKIKELRDKFAKNEISGKIYDESREAEKEKLKSIIEVQRAKIDQIRYDNTHVDKRLMNEVQMIFQDPIDSLDPRMTVEDIIKEGLEISRGVEKKEFKRKFNDEKNELKSRLDSGAISRDEYAQEIKESEKDYHYNLDKISKFNDRERVNEVLEKVGLIADYANRYPHEFSGGQRQRIGIARALIMNPKLLICDEPISALDVSIRAQIINLLNDLKEQMNLTLIFIAHDLSVVKYFCDRIAVMYFGEVVELATSDELFKHPLHPYTKSLLSAIPKPNPLTEKSRVRIPYDPAKLHDYSKEKPKLVEIEPGHFVLANSVEIERYKKEMSLD
jgi:oligopeptide transport system ATP-binding protein